MTGKLSQQAQQLLHQRQLHTLALVHEVGGTQVTSRMALTLRPQQQGLPMFGIPMSWMAMTWLDRWHIAEPVGMSVWLAHGSGRTGGGVR